MLFRGSGPVQKGSKRGRFRGLEGLEVWGLGDLDLGEVEVEVYILYILSRARGSKMDKIGEISANI